MTPSSSRRARLTAEISSVTAHEVLVQTDRLETKRDSITDRSMKRAHTHTRRAYRQKQRCSHKPRMSQGRDEA